MRTKRKPGLRIVPGIAGVGICVFLATTFITKDTSFLQGFIVCLAFVSLLLFMILAFKTGFFQSASDTAESTGKTLRISSSIWMLVCLLVILGVVVVRLLLVRQNEILRAQEQYAQTQHLHQSELIESVRRSGQVLLMNNVLDKVDEDLRINANRKLSDETIARIAALSFTFRPYAYPGTDSLSGNALSPERGQLLVLLSKMQIDSSSFSKIMYQVSFAGADLRQADLSNALLCGINLSDADLQDANLQGTHLEKANLKGTNFWGCNLKGALLNAADMKRADLSWADLHMAQLKAADLNGAKLSSADLRNADLSEATLQWADLRGAILYQADLTGTDLLGTYLQKANLSESNLHDADLTMVNITEANLSSAVLTNAIFTRAILWKAEFNGAVVSEENWLSLLETWITSGSEEIQDHYKITPDIGSDSTLYRLRIIEN